MFCKVYTFYFQSSIISHQSSIIIHRSSKSSIFKIINHQNDFDDWWFWWSMILMIDDWWLIIDDWWLMIDDESRKYKLYKTSNIIESTCSELSKTSKISRIDAIPRILGGNPWDWRCGISVDRNSTIWGSETFIFKGLSSDLRYENINITTKQMRP